MTNVLSTSTNALLAFQRALATVSHNVANIKTPGYSRQTTDFASRSPTHIGGADFGNGAEIVDVRRVADQLAISRLLDSSGETARLQQLSSMADRVDGLFSDSTTNLTGMWSNFFDSINGLAANAAGTADRRSVLDSANDLVQRFKDLTTNLDSLSQEVNNGLVASTSEINRLAKEIAQLNSTIGGNIDNAAPDLLDRRDQLVTELVGYTGGKAVIQDGGIMNVYSAGGHALVVGNSASTITTMPDPYRPERLQLSLQSPGLNVMLDNKALGGQVGGMLEFRDTILTPAQAELGRIAVGLATQFNQSHHEGMDLYGEMGGDFFNLAPPKVSPNNRNTGSAEFTAAYGDISELDGQNVELRYDGTDWVARRADTGAVLQTQQGTGTFGNPIIIVGGVELSVTGTPAEGDRFLLQPTTGASTGLSVAITDPSRIAAANPLRIESNLANIGSGVASKLDVTDAADVDLLDEVTVTFDDANTYTLTSGTPPVVIAPANRAFVPGSVVEGNGWSFVLDGKPAAGDTFTVSQNPAGSSDNGNAARLAAVEDTKAFNGGSISLTGAMGGLTTQVGAAARGAEYSLQAQQAINENAQATRDSISGVNLDEEAADMLRLQQAYQAASQLISTADNMFQTVLRAVS